MTYENISPSEAKSRMDANPEAVIVDVRRPDEFVTGHIPGRSGVRSVTAAVTLEKMGYTRLANFGGILDWPYKIEH